MAHVEGLAAGPPMDRSLRVTLNFHPDRDHHGIPLLAALARDGVYRSQFETGTSNGGLTAQSGGDRWRWEQRLFGGAYDDAPTSERPKYGALNHRRRSVGAAPRFGSAHLRLAEHVLDRTTFCFPDSFFEPEHVGTSARLGLIALADAFDAEPRDDHREATEGGRLDDYVEAHVHGVVDLRRDVEALVLDPCYRDTDVGRLAGRLQAPVEWHEGFRLDLEGVRRHPDFRGPRIVEVCEEVAVIGRLDPAIIGAAVRAGHHQAADLKKVWHLLARFGAPGAVS
ncbi:MAG: DUF3626 domain-containing protein [Lapillicoccus sp.]